MDVKSYKCINCGGALVFDSASGQMKCEYCDSTFDPEVLDTYEKTHGQADKDIEWDKKDSEEWQDEALKMYICQSCGAEIITDENTAATSCPYCGNVTVMSDRLSGTSKPDLVIPFKVSKKEAIEKMKEFCHGKPLLPSHFLEDSKIEEIKGMYVPFWLFDAKADATIFYDAERVETHRRGNSEIINTYHYLLERAGNLEFDKIPVDGSSKMDDVCMEAIEPFDYSEIIPFSTAYLAGFLADKYDVESSACEPRANERIVASTIDEFQKTVLGYTSAVATSKNIQLSEGNINYAMMPVWMVTTKWNNESFMYAVNGQTGKLVGNLPIDKAKAFAWGAGITAALTLIVNIIVQLIL